MALFSPLHRNVKRFAQRPSLDRDPPDHHLSAAPVAGGANVDLDLSAMASRMFANASASVLPWETQPGIAGHSATTIPVSSGSSVTRNVILS